MGLILRFRIDPHPWVSDVADNGLTALVIATRHIPGFDVRTLGETCDHAVPLPLISAEIEAAVRLAAPVPVYFGLELVRHPGVVDITPDLVREMVAAGRATNPAGVI